MGLEFRILGPLEVVADGAPLRLGGPRTRALLAALLVEAGRAVSRERLVDALWGEEPPATVENALQAQVAALRRLLPGRIATDGTSYRLLVQPFEFDARRFEEAVRDARGLLDRQPELAASRLAAALGLWRGPALDGAAAGPAVAAEAARLDAMRRAALLDRADACLALGQTDSVVADLASVVAGDPSDERLAQRLILAQYRASGARDALATFGRVRDALRDELDAAPDTSLQALREAIERHDPTLTRPTPGRPVPATRFVGREQEVVDVRELLGRSRLLTLVGPGGSGKTRLALEVVGGATGQREEVHFVALASLPPGGSVTRQIAGVLDVRDRHGEPLLDSIRARLRVRPHLLILDSCEHVLRPVAGLCADLLASLPGIRILATSREPLGIAGEVTWPVAGLAVPVPGASSAAILASDAVRLLAERAAAARPGFVLARSLAIDAGALCRRLDGLPLAIELAAARLRTMSPGELLARLSTRLDPLTPAHDGAAGRHRTMRAAIDWSHDLLADEERTVLRRMSVFRGSVDANGVVAVWGDLSPGDDPIASLGRLVDQSMVVAEPGTGAPTTYRLLETVRQYAEERLVEAGEEPAIRARHAAGCARMVAAARSWGGDDQETWLVRLGAAHNDLLAALGWLLGDGKDAEGALALAADLWWYWYVRGHFMEGSAWLLRALAAAAPVASSTRTSALRGASALARSGGDYSEAVRLGEECLQMCRQMHDREGVAASLNSLSATALAMGRVDEAVMRGTESLVVVRGTGNRRGLAASLTNLGTALRNLDRFDDAELAMQEAAAVFREIGDVRGETSTIINRAILELRRGRLEASREACADALEHCAVLGHAEGEVDCLDVVAAIEVADGDFAAGLRLFAIVDAARRRLGLEVSTPDERRDRQAALDVARASLDDVPIAQAESDAALVGIGAAAAAVLARLRPRN